MQEWAAEGLSVVWRAKSSIAGSMGIQASLADCEEIASRSQAWSSRLYTVLMKLTQKICWESKGQPGLQSETLSQNKNWTLWHIRLGGRGTRIMSSRASFVYIVNVRAAWAVFC